MNKYYTPVLLALLVSLAIGLYYRYPIGADVHFHIEFAETLAKGDISYFFKSHTLPYPPLLHLILTPSVWLGVQIPFAVLLQILFLPLTVWAVSRNFKGLPCFIAGLLVLGSYAFVDRAIQVNPQALDFVLFPLAFYYSQVAKNNNKFILVSTLMIWNHSFAALASLGGMFILKLYKQEWKPVFWIFLFSLPIVVSSLLLLPHLIPYFQLGLYESFQEQQFWSNPLTFTPLYQRLVFAGWLVVAYKIIHRKVSGLDLAALVSLASLLLMVTVWADRFVQYSTIPLAILFTSFVSEMKRGWKKESIVWAVIGVFLLFYFTLWIWLLANYYYVVG